MFEIDLCLYSSKSVDLINNMYDHINGQRNQLTLKGEGYNMRKSMELPLTQFN